MEARTYQRAESRKNYRQYYEVWTATGRCHSNKIASVTYRVPDSLQDQFLEDRHQGKDIF